MPGLDAEIGKVLFDYRNFPPSAQMSIMGADTTVLREKLVEAVEHHVNRVVSVAIRETIATVNGWPGRADKFVSAQPMIDDIMARMRVGGQLAAPRD